MIDDDIEHFSVERLRVWKSTAEQIALLELKSNPSSQVRIEDKEIIKFCMFLTVQHFNIPLYKKAIWKI